jgi:hypothetical protein
MRHTIRATADHCILPVIQGQCTGIFRRQIGYEAAFLERPVTVIRHVLTGIGFIVAFDQVAFQLRLTLGVDRLGSRLRTGIVCGDDRKGITTGRFQPAAQSLAGLVQPSQMPPGRNTR